MGTSRRLPPEGVDFHTPWRLTIDTCDRRPCESWDARTVSRWVFPAPTPEAIRRTIFRQLLSPRGRHCPPGDRDACHRVRARRRARCRSGPGHLALPLISHVRRCTVTLTLPSARPSPGQRARRHSERKKRRQCPLQWATCSDRGSSEAKESRKVSLALPGERGGPGQAEELRHSQVFAVSLADARGL